MCISATWTRCLHVCRGARSEQPAAFEKNKRSHAILPSTCCLRSTSLVQTSQHFPCTDVGAHFPCGLHTCQQQTLNSTLINCRKTHIFQHQASEFSYSMLARKVSTNGRTRMYCIAYKHVCRSNKPGYLLRKGVLSEWRHRCFKDMVIDIQVGQK